jgi:hypothetical protein
VAVPSSEQMQAKQQTSLHDPDSYHVHQAALEEVKPAFVEPPRLRLCASQKAFSPHRQAMLEQEVHLQEIRPPAPCLVMDFAMTSLSMTAVSPAQVSGCQ